MPRRSTTVEGAPSRPQSTPAAPQEPQSKQTKLLVKIHDLLKRLPRDTRSDVITNEFSQKQRVVLEKWMVDNVYTSSGTQGHLEAKALVPAGRSAPKQPDFETSEKMPRWADSSDGSCCSEAKQRGQSAKSMEKRECNKRLRRSRDPIRNEQLNATTSSMMPASDTQSLASEAAETHSALHLEGAKELKNEMDVTRGEGCYALAVRNSKIGPSVRTKRPAKAAKVKLQDKTKRQGKVRGCGYVKRAGGAPNSYMAGISFDSFVMRTGGGCDFKTALDYLVILFSVKQSIRNHTRASDFVERLQEALAASATEQGRNLADLKLSFLVVQHAGCFIGSSLYSPCVRNLEVFGKMRGVLEPFRQYAQQMGSKSTYWRYGPVHLEDAWKRLQSAVAEAWRLAGVDNRAILRKIRSLYKAHAPLRNASLQRWERLHMATQDKNANRPWSLREKDTTRRWQRWERRQMAMQDRNRHRPKRLRERSNIRLQFRERRRMALEDKNKHRPRHLRERRNARLEFRERQQMALEDKNKHRPKRLRLKALLIKKTEERLTRQLFALKNLIARWGSMLKREAKLVDKERQRILQLRKSRHKKDQEERKRAEILNRKRQQTEERVKRERIRKKMKSDLTMDDILGPENITTSLNKSKIKHTISNFKHIYLRNPLPSFFRVAKKIPGFTKKTYVFLRWYFNHDNQ